MTTVALPSRGERIAVRDAADWARLAVAVAARAVLFSLIGGLLWAALPMAWGWTSTTVMSDSMAPRILAGDVVVTMPLPASSISIGRVVLVDDPDHAARLRLHRYVAQNATGDLVLRGDANPAVDSSSVSPDHVHGVAVIRTPFIASPIVWAQHGQWGLVAATAVALVGLVLLAHGDVHLRRRRIEGGRVRERLRRSGTRALIAGVAALLLAVVSATGAHAALSATTASSASFAAASSFPCFSPTPSDSPFLYYAFDEVSGTSATDASSNSRTGTLGSGATRVAGSCTSSPAITLDGTSNGQVVTPTNVLVAPLTYSIEAWIKTTTTSGGKIIGYGNSPSGASTVYDRHLYMSNNGKVSFGVSNITNIIITSPTALNDGQWHHVVATMDNGLAGIGGTGMKLYVDGALVGSNANTGSQLSIAGYWRIGYDSVAGWGSPAPTSLGFAGSLDDVAVYSTALSSTRVGAHFAAGRQ